MSNPTVPTTPTTKDTSSKISQSVKDAARIDDKRETLNEFETNISHAQLNGDEWVETSQEIISYFNRNGLKGAKFFIYKGIKVCLAGQIQEIEDEMNVQLGVKIHGEAEAKVEGR